MAGEGSTIPQGVWGGGFAGLSGREGPKTLLTLPSWEGGSSFEPIPNPSCWKEHVRLLLAGMLPRVSPPARHCSSSRLASLEHLGVTRFACSSSAAGARLWLQQAYTRSSHTLQHQRAGRTTSFSLFQIRALAAASQSCLPSLDQDPCPGTKSCMCLAPQELLALVCMLGRHAGAAQDPQQVTESSCF